MARRNGLIATAVAAVVGVSLALGGTAFAHGDAPDAAGHEQQVMHLAGGHAVTLGAGITMVGQGVDGPQGVPGGATYSVDIALESEVADGATAFVYINSAQGSGVDIGAVGSGVNADDESGDVSDGGYSDTRIAEAWLRFPLSGMASLTVGKIDPTGIYDANELANDEAAQFLNDAFVNNPAIAFPGYVLGASLSVEASDNVAVSVGAFEQADDADGGFNSSFLIGEVDLSAELAGRPGNLRLIGWSAPGASGGPDNSGFAVSADLAVTDTTSLFARYGSQDSAQDFDSALSFGGQLNVGEGVAGAGYSLLTRAATGDEDESAIELYYAHPLVEGITVTGDVQFVQGAGLSATADDATVYGLRMQVDL